MDPKEALRLSQQLTDPADQNRVTARRDQIKTEKFNDKYVDWTRDIVGETNPTSFQNAVNVSIRLSLKATISLAPMRMRQERKLRR